MPMILNYLLVRTLLFAITTYADIVMPSAMYSKYVTACHALLGW